MNLNFCQKKWKSYAFKRIFYYMKKKLKMVSSKKKKNFPYLKKKFGFSNNIWESNFKQNKIS